MEISNNIIGNFLDINKDISMIESNSKIKFIAKLQQEYYRRKLIKKVQRILNINTPLSKDNILELFLYIYSNYLPDGKFGNIINIRYYEKSNYYIGVVIVDNYSYNIKISEYTKNFTVNAISYNKKENKGFSVELDKLYSDNKEIEKALNPLNQALIDTMYYYILDNIKR